MKKSLTKKQKQLLGNMTYQIEEILHPLIQLENVLSEGHSKRKVNEMLQSITHAFEIALEMSEGESYFDNL